jgi:sulfite exporter TauE/SafE
VSIAVLAGAVSTVIFAVGTLPMLLKAARTRDLGSYSLSQILLNNVGNLVHTVYVVHLPLGPIWLLHGFYLVSTALMLLWYVRYALRRQPADVHSSTHAGPTTGLGVAPDAILSTAS